VRRASVRLRIGYLHRSQGAGFAEAVDALLKMGACQ
jgi:hypothetical protein